MTVAETLLLSNSLKHLTSNPFMQRNKVFRRVRTPHPKYFTQARNKRGAGGVNPTRQNFARLEKCVGHSLKTLDTFPKLWSLLSTRGRNRVIASWPKFSKTCSLVRCNIKLQSFCHHRKHQLGAALNRKNVCANSKIPSISLE